MSIFGKQYFHCPNCGHRQYDGRLNMNHVLSLTCSKTCLQEFQLKYTKQILGKNAEKETAQCSTEKSSSILRKT